MFNITSYKVDQITGFTDIEIKFNIGAEDKVERRSYMKEDSARQFIIEFQRDYILIMFEKYVYHAIVLFEVGHRDFYRTQEKTQSLDKCKRANDYFNPHDQSQKIPLKDICKYILRIEEDLRRILPSPNNNSYSSSEQRLLDMIVFSKKQVQPIVQSVKNFANA